MKWKDERQGPHQVGSDAKEDAALPIGLEHETELAGLEIAQAAVDQPARARAGARAEIALLHQHRSESPHRRIASHTGAGDSAADDEESAGCAVISASVALCEE